MEFRPFTPLHMFIQLVLVVVLLGGNYLYVNWFLKNAEPGAKAATEARLGIGIERNIFGSWSVPGENLVDYQGSKTMLRLQVFAINLGVMLAFMAGFLVEIVLLYLFFGWFYRGST